MTIGDEWWPKQSKMVFYNIRDGETNKLIFHVDPGSPLIWKSEPYYSQLKRMAVNGLGHNGIINIYIGKRVIVILPDNDVDLGICELNDKIVCEKIWNGSHFEINVHKLPQTATIA